MYDHTIRFLYYILLGRLKLISLKLLLILLKQQVSKWQIDYYSCSRKSNGRSFVEEAADEQQQVQVIQGQQQNPQPRGRGALCALAAITADAALLDTDDAIGGAMRRKIYGYGMTPKMGPMMGSRMKPPPPRPMGMRGSMMMGPRW